MALHSNRMRSSWIQGSVVIDSDDASGWFGAGGQVAGRQIEQLACRWSGSGFAACGVPSAGRPVQYSGACG